MSKPKKPAKKQPKPNPIPGNKPFPPGVSGNPNGRPKGLRNRSTIVREWLEANYKKINPITGQQETLPIQDHLVISLIGKALKGDVHAFRELFDSGHGKVKDVIQHEGNKELPLAMEVSFEDPTLPSEIINAKANKKNKD